MSVIFQRGFRLLLMCFSCTQAVPLCAQGPAIPVAVASAKTVPMPVLQSPVVAFRELLAMTPVEREARLAKSAPDKRARLLAKIHEYDTMTAAVREESLAATELHWYLQQFLPKSAANHGLQLSQVPQPYRDLVAKQLKVWEILPPPLQKEVLAHESTRNFFLLGSRPRADVPKEIMPPSMSQEFNRLDNLPAEKRQQIFANFQQFFQLTDVEKQAVLNAIPATERQQVQSTLISLSRLPPEQRAVSLKSLDQLAALTDERRREFFENAQRWKELSLAEKQTWLKLVTHLPPMPPLSPRTPPVAGLPVATSPAP